MKKSILLLSASMLLFVSACKKDPGEGGFASIKGKVFVKDYNTYFTVLNGEYYGQAENVYIIYGDDARVGNSIKTAYDGSFQFDFLRKGKYKVYALSKDSAYATSSKTKEILMQVTIVDRKQKVELPDLVILK